MAWFTVLLTLSVATAQSPRGFSPLSAGGLSFPVTSFRPQGAVSQLPSRTQAPLAQPQWFQSPLQRITGLTAQDLKNRVQTRKPTTPSTGFGLQNGYVNYVINKELARLNPQNTTTGVLFKDPYNQYTDQPLLDEVSPFTPVGSELGPAVVDQYIQQLTRHGKILSNRVLAWVGGSIAADGPVIAPYEVRIPKGYQPVSMDLLYIELFMYLGRCTGPSFEFRRRGSAVIFDFTKAPEFQPNADMGKLVAQCMIGEVDRWIDGQLIPYVAAEASRVIDYLKKHPFEHSVTWPTFANFAGSHKWGDAQTIFNIARAYDVTAEAIISQAKQNALSPRLERYVPDWDALLATPVAASRFGFPLGFYPKNLESITKLIEYTLQFCVNPGYLQLPDFVQQLIFPAAKGLDPVDICFRDIIFQWENDQWDAWTHDQAQTVLAFIRPYDKVIPGTAPTNAPTKAPTKAPATPVPATSKYPVGDFCSINGKITPFGTGNAASVTGVPLLSSPNTVPASFSSSPFFPTTFPASGSSSTQFAFSTSSSLPSSISTTLPASGSSSTQFAFPTASFLHSSISTTLPASGSLSPAPMVFPQRV